MDSTASISEVTCNVSRSRRSSHHFALDVTACIKQEAAEDHCSRNSEGFVEIRDVNYKSFDVSLTKLECNEAQKPSAGINCHVQSVLNEDDNRDRLSTKPFASIIKRVKQEEDRHGNEPWSVLSAPGSITDVKRDEECKAEVEDHALGNFKMGLVKREVYDDHCRQAELREHGASDVDEAAGVCTFVDICDVKAEHVTHSVGSQAEVFKCTKCNFKVKDKNWLARHVKIYHNDRSSETKRQKNPSINTKAFTNLYSCTECDFTSKIKYSLTTHVTFKHNSNAPLYQCVKCDFAAKSKGNLSKHVARKHSPDAPVYRCAQCSYTTKLKYDLSTHFNVQHDEHAPLYRCPHCDYSTKFNRLLTQHVKIRHDPHAKLYRCTACDFVTKQSYYLTRHVTVKHSADAPVHQCAECSYATKIRSELTTHVAIKHNSGRPAYRCARCAFTTTLRSYLTKHVARRHSPDGPVHRCTECGYATKMRHDLSGHVKRKHSQCEYVKSVGVEVAI